MSTSTKVSTVALLAIGLVSLFVSPAVSRADDKVQNTVQNAGTVAGVDKTNSAAATSTQDSVRFGANKVAVPFEVAAPSQPKTAAAAENAPADQSSKGGVIYRRLALGNFMASHYDGTGKLTRRDIYRQPNELLVIHFDGAGKVTHRQTFFVWLDVYLREGKFGYQHQWMFELRRLEVFQADGKTHAKVVVFYPQAGPARIARDFNARGGVTAIRHYRADGTLMTEELYKNGRLSRIVRHTAKENRRETLDPLHTAVPTGTILSDSEDNSKDSPEDNPEDVPVNSP